jgi:hypothetical protein
MSRGGRQVLVARLDADGDVLLAGPAVRAVAASARVVLLVGPRGRQAAALLPGVDEVVEWAAPWIEPAPAPEGSSAHVDTLVGEVRARHIDSAVVLTSFHQSALPLALLLRMAGVGHIGAVSEDYPGSLLDVRLPDPGEGRRPSEVSPSRRRAGSRCRTGTTVGCRCTVRCPTRRR